MAKHETTEDIIAQLRKPREGENAYLTVWRDEIADRFDAAHRRERISPDGEAGAAKRSLEGCNSAALREALAPFPSLCDWLVVNASKLGIPDMVAKLRERGDKARAALAAPEREGGAK